MALDPCREFAQPVAVETIRYIGDTVRKPPPKERAPRRSADRSSPFMGSSKEYIQSLGSYPGRITLILADNQPKGARLSYDDPTNGWGAIADGGVDVIHVSGDHWTMFDPPNLQSLANALRVCLGGAGTTAED